MDRRAPDALALAYFLASLNRPVRLPPSFSPVAMWNGSADDLVSALQLRPQEKERLVRFRASFSFDDARATMRSAGISFVAWGDQAYPEPLLQIYDPPVGLFISGSPERLKELISASRIAIVGSRKASPYGIDAATRLAETFARSRVCVISGMALGIDAAAHRGALDCVGASIAVLGCGVDVVYPRANQLLYRQLHSKGLIVSEYPPATQPRAWRFPARNRIIAGLSQAVVVVEAQEKSGALITADFALEQGREVYAVPGSIFSVLSSGPNKLIKLGASIVTKAEDVLDDLGIKPRQISLLDDIELPDLSEEERRLYLALGQEPCHQDLLARQAGVATAAAAAALIALELRGLARHATGRGYCRRC